MTAASAPYFLNSALAAISQRAASRDQDQERSMARTVSVFNAITGMELSELDGWKFMIALKLARSAQGSFHEDDYVDLCGYAALAGECGSTWLDDLLYS